MDEEEFKINDGTFIYRPALTDTQEYKVIYKTMCGICQDELKDNAKCLKVECIEENELIRQESNKPRCLQHGCDFFECLQGNDCKAAQNLKSILNKG